MMRNLKKNLGIGKEKPLTTSATTRQPLGAEQDPSSTERGALFYPRPENSGGVSALQSDTSGDEALRARVQPLPRVSGEDYSTEGKVIRQSFLVPDIIEYIIGNFLMSQPAETSSMSFSGSAHHDGKGSPALRICAVQPQMMAPKKERLVSSLLFKCQRSADAHDAHYQDVTRRQKYPPQLRIGGVYLTKDVGSAVPGVCKEWLAATRAIMDEARRSARLNDGVCVTEIPRRLLSVAVTDHVHGGGTGGEWPLNILQDGSEGWNKWYSTAGASSGNPVCMTFLYKSDLGLKPEECPPYRFKGYAFRTANDCPNRDPIIWTVVKIHGESALSGEGEAKRKKSEVLHRVQFSHEDLDVVVGGTGDNAHQSLTMPRERWQWRTYLFPKNATPITLERGDMIEFQFEDVRQNRDGRQLGQIALFGDMFNSFSAKETEEGREHSA